MIPDGEYTAVVDRIEDGLATLEASASGERYELVVAEATLPEGARHARTTRMVRPRWRQRS